MYEKVYNGICHCIPKDDFASLSLPPNFWTSSCQLLHSSTSILEMVSIIHGVVAISWFASQKSLTISRHVTSDGNLDFEVFTFVENTLC